EAGIALPVPIVGMRGQRDQFMVEEGLDVGGWDTFGDPVRFDAFADMGVVERKLPKIAGGFEAGINDDFGIAVGVGQGSAVAALTGLQEVVPVIDVVGDRQQTGG